MLKGSCHCGSVEIEVATKPETLTECTCSICRRYGARWAYYTQSTVTISYENDPVTYRWGDKMIDFFHCGVCGCMTHYEGVDPGDDPESRVGVNSRMLDPKELTDVPVRTFDGAETWTYLD